LPGFKLRYAGFEIANPAEEQERGQHDYRRETHSQGYIDERNDEFTWADVHMKYLH
jgi:hypothetical protein